MKGVEVGKIQVGVFYCPKCQDSWKDEIPPLWTGKDCWPTCKTCPTRIEARIYNSPALIPLAA